MFGSDVYLLDDNAVRIPRRFRPYQVFDFDTLGEDGSGGDVNAANERLPKYLSATWRGNSAARHAEMVDTTLEYAGREAGRFPTP